MILKKADLSLGKFLITYKKVIYIFTPTLSLLKKKPPQMYAISIYTYTYVFHIFNFLVLTKIYISTWESDE